MSNNTSESSSSSSSSTTVSAREATKQRAAAIIHGYLMAYEHGTDDDRRVVDEHVASGGDEHKDLDADLSDFTRIMARVGTAVSGMDHECPKCGPVQLGTKCPVTLSYHAQ